MTSILEHSSTRLSAAATAMDDPDPAALDAALDQLDGDDWSQLEGLLGTASTRSVRSTRSRENTAPPLGDAVVLPGIMGSDLGLIGADGAPSRLWFNVPALAGGAFTKLRLPTDGGEPEHEIVVGGPLKFFYLPMQMKLNQRWRARTFPYDWRHDLGDTADRLNDEVKRSDPPVHLVAHSMGGLVCRAMIARHPETWERMAGRLVMLGTPNRGSFAPVLALTAQDRKLCLLALLDSRLDKWELARIVATFPGLAQMLPSASAALDPAVDQLYRQEWWPGTPISQHLLDRAGETHCLLEGVVDEERMVYIAGYGHRTVDGVELNDGHVRYRRSRAGDGTVPHVLGLLPGVPTYWSRAKHGALVKDSAVLNAVDDLLLHGTTSQLPMSDRSPSARGGDAEWLDAEELDAEVVAAVARSHNSSRDIDLLDDVLPSIAPSGIQVPIRLEVVWGGIETIDADVAVVGHYLDVFPTAAELALDKAISGTSEDRRRLLHAATARGALRGTLGEVFIVPWQRDDGRTISAMVVGLGRPGTFMRPQHEVVVRNLVWTAERALGAASIGCVLIGAGAGNMSVEAAVSNLVRSLDCAVRESELCGRLEVIRIVEVDLGRARTILACLCHVLEDRDRGVAPAIIDVNPELVEGGGGMVTVETVLGGLVGDLRQENSAALGERLARVEPSATIRAAMVRALDEARDTGDRASYTVSHDQGELARSVPTRLSVLEVGGRLVASAVSDAATVPERDFGVDASLFTQLVDLANTQAAGDPTTAGRMLLRVAIRPEFRPLLELDRDVVIEVDRTTAAFPWEVLGSSASSPIELAPLGVRTPLARQLRTRQSPPPVVTGRVVLTRALVIGDPGGAGGRLPGAEREALAVANALYERDIVFDILMGTEGMTDPERRWNAQPATLANVLHQLLHEEYQLVHYAGHATFSSGDSADANGWVLADGLLTGRHLEIVERLPPLVVANACHSSRVSTDLPGLADEFIGRGVRNLVGTARTVNDESARRFSDEFYDRLLSDERTRDTAQLPTLGNAVLAGRRELYHGELLDWDVYQLYGDPSFRFWPDALGREP